MEGGIRPTKDKVREALFSSLGNINGKAFLDMYAGSGSIGLEAASRGAAPIYFIDNNKAAIKCIKDNISSLGVENTNVIESDVMTALKRLSESYIVFDYIYLDPPYKQEQYTCDLLLLNEYHLLSSDAIIVVESDHPLSEADFPLYEIIKRKNFGFINLTYFQVKK
ncbi:MAG: 16S rRNA (guanine(966)-N(2))-methyltransferase RsmD [Coprobacillus sp.]|nr:16S rRNA (guanine(966)-N(2))-methyltransferase RsmD [Coprobacillus sp.]